MGQTYVSIHHLLKQNMPALVDYLQTRRVAYYSGYPSGLKRTSLRAMMAKKPEDVLRLAVRRMLPKGALGNRMLKKLKLCAGPNHPYQAQQPRKTMTND